MSLTALSWPPWLTHVVWTVLTAAGSYLLGRLINRLLISRLARLAERTEGEWDDIVIDEIRRRIPWLALLGGAWLSLADWPMDPHVTAIADGTIFALAIALATLALATIASRLVAAYGPKHASGVPITALTHSIVKLLILLLGALVILNGLGVSITPMLTALGVGGLAMALALQEPLSNLFAGVFLSAAGQIKLGDYVRLDSGLEGYVSDVNWRATRIRTLANSFIIVPNAKLSQAIVTVVTNYRQPAPEVPFAVDVGVDSKHDLDQLEAMTLDVARDVMHGVAGGVPAFEPAIRYKTLGEARVRFSVILRAKDLSDQDLVRHEFVKRLHARYHREGVMLHPAHA